MVYIFYVLSAVSFCCFLDGIMHSTNIMQQAVGVLSLIAAGVFAVGGMTAHMLTKIFMKLDCIEKKSVDN